MARKPVRKSRPAPPVDESRKAKFERILTARMQRVLNSIRLLGNLSSSAYEWDQDALQLIRTAIADQLNASMSRFDKAKPARVEFKLPEKLDL